MIKLRQTATFSDIRLSIHELTLLSNALNEVCNGGDIDDAEFATRLGAERDELRQLLENIGSAIL
ncbi:hypothetical protein B7G68_04800 [Caulobacter segnis]|uniref:Uncharacterized protein n=2 Tax=Caulobacter segnis TaxID=88688 RepID=D5VF23_CAUST|nr:hypothetical protein [Caulobacter segnis]ADG09441.1 hypothetical protein Cseg_0936 [Caulobacter segnis ATCC 21756]AVQ01238.1 hypothetical protein B7G68_04800 [Caulobacter segnis]